MSEQPTEVQWTTAYEVLPRFPCDPPCVGRCKESKTWTNRLKKAVGGYVYLDTHLPGPCNGSRPKIILHADKPDGTKSVISLGLTDVFNLHDLFEQFMLRVNDDYELDGGIMQVARYEPDEPSEAA